jgi:hypothetical protein
MVADTAQAADPFEPDADATVSGCIALGKMHGCDKAGVREQGSGISRSARNAKDGGCVKTQFPWGVRYTDGREVCNLLTKAGSDEYQRRKRAMWERQKRRCCLESCVGGCPGKLKLADAVFEHQDGRGMAGGHRDDRIMKDGKPYNGVAHAWCNTLKGSVRVNYHLR